MVRGDSKRFEFERATAVGEILVDRTRQARSELDRVERECDGPRRGTPSRTQRDVSTVRRAAVGDARAWISRLAVIGPVEVVSDPRGYVDLRCRRPHSIRGDGLRMVVRFRGDSHADLSLHSRSVRGRCRFELTDRLTGWLDELVGALSGGVSEWAVDDEPRVADRV